MKNETKKVKIMLPRARVGEDDFKFVGYNGVGYQIKRGEQVEVPEAVAKILATGEDQEIKLAELIKEASDIKEMKR